MLNYEKKPKLGKKPGIKGRKERRMQGNSVTLRRMLPQNLVDSEKVRIFALAFGAKREEWPIRLSVRTQDFHS